MTKHREAEEEDHVISLFFINLLKAYVEILCFTMLLFAWFSNTLNHKIFFNLFRKKMSKHRHFFLRTSLHPRDLHIIDFTFFFPSRVDDH